MTSNTGCTVLPNRNPTNTLYKARTGDKKGENSYFLYEPREKYDVDDALRNIFSDV